MKQATKNIEIIQLGIWRSMIFSSELEYLLMTMSCEARLIDDMKKSRKNLDRNGVHQIFHNMNTFITSYQIFLIVSKCLICTSSGLSHTSSELNRLIFKQQIIMLYKTLASMSSGVVNLGKHMHRMFTTRPVVRTIVESSNWYFLSESSC